MNVTKIQTKIAWLTSGFVLLIAIGSFVLSYNSLHQVALSNGINQELSYLWPFLVDFPLVVFSLCAIIAYLHKESTWQIWSLVAGYVIATMGFNVIHAWPEILPALATRVIVTCVPPLSLLLSFELLMMQLKNSIKRQGLQSSATELSTLIDGYNTQLATLQGKLAQVSQQLNDVQKQSQKASDDTTQGRREQVARMKVEGITQKQMAELLGVSISTVRNDIKNLNGVGK